MTVQRWTSASVRPSDLGGFVSYGDYLTLQQRLAAETKNKEQFERDWLECCDALARQRQQLEDYAHANIQDRQDLAACQAREKVLRDALDSVRQYGSDTLSGRASGPDDRTWQRDGVLEMTRRARIALAQPADDTALQDYIAGLPEMQLLDEIGKMLEDVEYKGSYVDGIKAMLAVAWSEGYEKGKEGYCEAIKRHLAAERERCIAAAISTRHVNQRVIDAIRALGDE